MVAHLIPQSLLFVAALTLVQHATVQNALASSEFGLIADVPNAMQQLSVQTVTVNRYGSMCPAPSISISTSSHIAPSAHTTAFSASTTASQSPIPSPTFTRCIDPVCPALNNDACLDAAGKTYGISCNASLSGLVAFPPKLRPRTYAADFTSCLAICDAEGGCHGVSYSNVGSNCLLYGQITGTRPQNGSIVARRLETYT